MQFTWDQDTLLNNYLDDLDNFLFLGFNGNQCEVIPASITDHLISDNAPASFTAGALISDNRIDLGQYKATLPLVIVPK